MSKASRRKAESGSNKRVASAIASDSNRLYVMTPLAAAIIAALNPAGAALAQDEERAVDEIIVTATKRELNLQDVPHSIDVLSGAEIARMGARDIEATVKALPSLYLTALQPGQNSLVMRGISTGPYQYYTEAQVAVYIDEQPMTFNSQQVGVRSIDIERIENLPGPQGTLFGSSSQTGTIRYITNKPQMESLAGQVEARWGTTHGGDDSYDISGVINLPVSDSFAIRAVGFTSHDGGYVDNVLGTSFTGNYDNSNLVEDNFNEYDVDGGRLHALWNMSDKWSALATIIAENTTADGVWDSDAFLGDYKVTRFENEIRTDDWYSASLTLDGDLGFADLSFTYAHFDRDIAYQYDNMTYQQFKDYTYAYGLYDTDYYRSVIFNDQNQKRDTFEARLVSKGDTRLQWMVGGYYEDILDKWFYGNKTPGLVNTTAWYYAQYYAYYYGVSSNYYNNYTPNTNITYPLPETDVFWANNLDRTVKQTAFFGEVSYDLTDDLTIHGGIRWAQYDRYALQRNQVPFGLPVSLSSGDGSFVDDGKDSDTIYKLGLRYNVNDDFMVYGLFSQGFRVGGFNSARAANLGFVPRTFDSDLINNYELGIKSQWANGRLTFNGDIFYMEWKDYQDSTNAGGPWWARGNVNIGDAEITGVEAQLDWKVTERLNVSANLYAADSEFKDNYCGEFLNGIEQPCPVDGSGNIDPDALEVRAGMRLPNAPAFKAFASIYYTIPDVLNGDLWLYYDYTYSSDVWNETYDIVDNNTAGLAPSWSYSTFSAGLRLPSEWDVEINVRNLFDDKGYSYVWTGEADEADTFGDPRYHRIRAQERPRTIWLTVRKGFGGI